MNEPGREFLDLLCATVALGAFRSVLAEVVVLADESPNLSDEQLRAALMALDHATRRLVGVGAVSAHGVGSPRDDRADRLVGGIPPARLSPVAVRFSDRSCRSLVCTAACAERTIGSGLVTGWPLVEVPPTPGGQPVPSPARPLDRRCEPHLARGVGGGVRELRDCGERPISTALSKTQFLLRHPGGSAIFPQLLCLECPLLSGDPAPGERRVGSWRDDDH